MKLAGFNFIKVNVEKKSSNLKDLKIDTKIDIRDIKLVETSMFKTEEKFLAIQFEYFIDYKENVAKVDLLGDIILSLENDLAEKVLSQWKESKKMPEEFKIKLFNLILRKSTVKALQLEEEMNLPLHVPLPRLENNSEIKNNK